MSISKAYLNRLDTRLLDLAEKLENIADCDAGETEEQEERAEALREIAELLHQAREHIEPWIDL